jgi:aspartyl-tRNA(Asn)/glutamyl-tRNA(Gln) amidotransferase subunit A
MGDTPWTGDACSLVDAFRRGERSPTEELDAVFTAIDASPLNAFSHVDRERATLAAGVADVSLPFGGVPIGVKELDEVAGWPFTHASVPFADQIATATSTMAQRIRDRGGVAARSASRRASAGSSGSRRRSGASRSRRTPSTATSRWSSVASPVRCATRPGGSTSPTATTRVIP